MYIGIIGVILGFIAIGLSIYFNKQQQTNNSLVEGDVEHIHNALLALQKEFTHYQVETSRIISQLEDKVDIQGKNQIINLNKLKKDLPFIIGKVVGQIEFAQDKINKQI